MEVKDSIKGMDADLYKKNSGDTTGGLVGYPIRNMPGAPIANSNAVTTGSKQIMVGLRFVTSLEFEKLIVQELQGWNRGEWKDPFEVRILSYTNEAVRTYNRLARNARYLPLDRQIQFKSSTATSVSEWTQAATQSSVDLIDNKPPATFLIPSTPCIPSSASFSTGTNDPQNIPAGSQTISPGLLPPLDPILVGDLLMGYENLGWPTPYIENGQDYLVVSVRRVENHPIQLGQDEKGKIIGKTLAVGWLVTMGETMHDSMDVVPATVKTHFFPDIDCEKNIPILQELRRRAQLVNQPNSSTKAYKHYYELKDQLIFMECLYEYRGKIYGESHFFREHPLLATNVAELIKEEFNPVRQPGISEGPTRDIHVPDVQHKDGKVKNEDNPRPKGVRSLRQHFLYDQISALYPNLVEERMMSYHMLGDSEELGDRFLFIEKDVDYGYSLTVHKSQASTYNRVYVDDSDIAKIRDRWNYQHNAWYRASKERNQLKYVAVTRARHLVTVLSILKEDRIDNDFEFDGGTLFDPEKEMVSESFDLNIRTSY
jgi:hypothetical protein